MHINDTLFKCCPFENTSVQINKHFCPLVHADDLFTSHTLTNFGAATRSSSSTHYSGIIYQHIPFFWLLRQQFKHRYLSWVSRWRKEIQIHSRLSPRIPYLGSTICSELSDFDNVSISQSSHCSGLSISVLWTMIIHARFLIKTCHHASRFYALNKHNNLCICLEIFRSKCKPLARVDPIINRPFNQLVWKPM